MKRKTLLNASPRRKKQLGKSYYTVKDEGGRVWGKMGDFTTVKTKKNPLQPAFELIDLDSGEIRPFIMDGGLTGAFKLCKVEKGMFIEIEHCGKKVLKESGNSCNVYKIYEIEPESSEIEEDFDDEDEEEAAE